MSENQNQIQWYPGHMARARREIAEAVKLVDVVIELVDARIPVASRNPVLNEIIGEKPRIIVLNKADLANGEDTKNWIKKYKEKGQAAVEVNSNVGSGINHVLDAVYDLMKEKLERKEKQGLVGASVKAMVVGIPNVGKSSFINKVAKKPTTATGNKPGVTRKNQWVRLNDRIQLLDTPGVLWPKFEDEKLARHLAYIGTIKDDIMDVEELSFHLVTELLEIEKAKLFERFKISEDFEYEMPLEVLEEIGRKRGCLVRGGEIDYTKVANIILEEFRSGKIGRITLEK
ncbi:MAG: ribosome biogenesis GTPase YlqF [Clostridia bacterium]|nr:ribosome biogenesis GTPase YlqF [Clostridia bacterium]